jgi:predicted secreted protein
MALVTIDEHNAGHRVQAQVDDRIDLVLPENPTTGFQWQLEDPGGALALESSEFEPPDELRPGAGGQRHVVLRAVSAGTSTVRLRLQRAWESRAESTFEVDVRVT